MLRQINPAARIRSAMLTYAPRFGIRMIINNKQASNKLLNMQSTLSQTTPWSFGLFLMVTTVPAFYFLH